MEQNGKDLWDSPGSGNSQDSVEKDQWNGQNAQDQWSGQNAQDQWNGQNTQNQWSGQNAQNQWSGQNAQNQWNGQNAQAQWNGQGAQSYQDYQQSYQQGSGYQQNYQQGSGYQGYQQGSGYHGGYQNGPFNSYNGNNGPVFQRQPVFYNGKLNRGILKQEAKTIFKANYGNMLFASIIPTIILGGVALIPYAGAIISWLCGPILEVGGIFLALEIIRAMNAQAGDLFKPFNKFGQIFGAEFVTNLFIGLWSLLFVIPGIYKAYCWFMVPYILADNPDLTGSQARELSNRMMYGHKWELFVLQLSFIGWLLLSALTAGILGIFYVNPWMHSTMCDYYDNLKMLDEANQQNQWNR